MVKDKLIKGVDEKIWNKLKIYCIKNNLTMAKAIANILKDFFKDKNKQGGV